METRLAKPSLCRAVIYVDKSRNEFAATIASIQNGLVNLGCLDHDGHPFAVQDVSYDLNFELEDRQTKPESWHWPPRV